MRLVAHNAALPALFEDIAHQLFSQLIDLQTVGSAHREKIAVEGETLEELLQAWVNALLDALKGQHMVFGSFRVTDFQSAESGPYRVRAEAIGELLDPHRHHLTQDISAMTCRHTLLIKDSSGYRAEIDLG